jgi:hypothetical protein
VINPILITPCADALVMDAPWVVIIVVDVIGADVDVV